MMFKKVVEKWLILCVRSIFHLRANPLVPRKYVGRYVSTAVLLLVAACIFFQKSPTKTKEFFLKLWLSST